MSVTKGIGAGLLAEPVYEGGAVLGEGPVWHEGRLWFVDIDLGTLNRFDPETGRCESRPVGPRLGCAVPGEDGLWRVAFSNSIGAFDWNTGRLDVLAEPEKGRVKNRFNDGKCDPKGRFFAGTMSAAVDEIGAGTLYRVDFAAGGERRVGRKPSDGQEAKSGDGQERMSAPDRAACIPIVPHVTISNGLAWSPDGRRFYHTDCLTYRIDVYDYDLDRGLPSGRRELVRIPETVGMPDGFCMDAEGHLWVALWEGGAVLRLDGRTGAILARVDLPVSLVTSCAFGGEGLRDLYITTATVGLSPAQRASQPLAGALFRMRPGVPGCPVSPARFPA